MLTSNFYFQTIRRITANFGSLFDNIEFVKDSSVSPIDSFIVPLSFAPRNYFISRVNEKSSIDNNGKPITSHNFPAMSFEMTGFEYDSERQTNMMITIPENSENNSGQPLNTYRTNFNLVPYNISYRLNIFARKNEDLLQILEQILPYFAPHYTLNVDLGGGLGIKKNIQVNLDSNSFEDEWENSRTDFRLLTQSLDFTAKGYVIPPIQDLPLIERAQLYYYDEINANAEHILQRYITEDDL